MKLHLFGRAATAALLLYSSATRAQNAKTIVSTPTATSSSTACSTLLTPSYSAPVVAEGWRAQLLATGLTRPRGMKFDANGGLLVVEAGAGITHLKLADNGDTCLSVESSKSVITDEELTHGIELSEDGRTLYASTVEAVYSWSYDPDAVSADNQRSVIFNMSNSDHVTRTLLLSRKQPGLLLVSRGSGENIDELAAQQSSGISQIRAFNISNITDSSRPYDYPNEGLLVGWGLRNSVGVAEHPVTGGIWSVENSADQIVRMGRDIHEDNPGEELNFHGYLNDTSAMGANYGYPHCFALWNTTDFPERGDLTVGDQFVLDNTASLNDAACARDFAPPRLTFRAHTAPLDIKFLPATGAGAFVSFHGSWDRDAPAGYKVSYVRFDPSTGQPAEPPDSVAAAVDILSNPDTSACPEACFRPAGLAFDPRGERLFVSSDATGEIYVLARTGPGPVPTTTFDG
ncbi:hypothetical protein VTK56DRAFT_3878 [Thermocarpiscus australiensis]